MGCRTKRTLLAFLAVGITLAGCQPRLEPVSEAELERAGAVLAPFKEQLLGALMGALEEGDFEDAIEICRDRAPQIARDLSVQGVEMGRSSHKLRNPDNAPEAWVEPLLAAYLEEPSNASPRAVRVDAATLGYVEPIYMKSFCLGCHGPSIDPTLYQHIRSTYPQDQAIGFKVDDLRGLFWVTLPAGGQGS